MPYINLKILKGATQEQKEKLFRGVAEVVSEVLGKDPKATYMVIDEVETDNWGIGGESMTQRRKKG